jgi:hypothetical protein
MCGAHLFGLSNVSQAGLEPAVATKVAVAVLKFSQCNVLWGGFLWARHSVCQRFDSGWCFVSVKCGSNVSGRFWSHRTHAVCIYTLVAILDSPLSILCNAGLVEMNCFNLFLSWKALISPQG